MMHLCAYLSTTQSNAAPDTDIPALADSSLTIQNNHFLPQIPMYIAAAYGLSTSLSRLKISSPKIRQINPLYVRPIDFGAALPSANPNIDLKFFSPYLLQQLEEIQILATTTAVGPETLYALLWLMDQLPQPSSLGDVYTARWTSTATTTLNVWTQLGQLTFEQVFPFGQYALLDADYIGVHAVAHRYVFDQQYWRPGSIGMANTHTRMPYAMSYGKFGNWGTFRTTNLPRAEILSGTGDSSHEGYLHVVKIA